MKEDKKRNLKKQDLRRAFYAWHPLAEYPRI